MFSCSNVFSDPWKKKKKKKKLNSIMKLHYTHFDHYTSKLTFSCDCSGTGIQLLQKLEELLNCSCDF